MTEEEEFEDLFAESILLANLPHDALTSNTPPIAQAPEQEHQHGWGKLMNENRLIDNASTFKADGTANMPFRATRRQDCRSPLTSSILTPLASRPSDTVSTARGHETSTNSSQLSTPRPLAHSAKRANAEVISKIEAIFESLADGILEERGTLSIPLRRRASKPKAVPSPQGGNGTRFELPKPKDVFFPGSTPQEAWRFTVLVRILELMHEALVDNTITTKRDIYYKDSSLFGKQTVVDRYVDDLAYTFEVQRSALNVVAAAKGLVIGSFTMTRSNGTKFDGASEHGGILVPNIHDIDDIDISGVSWVLVIEKEATFRSLAINRFYMDSSVGQGIIITAKGYPDISTRAFLRCLSLSNEIGRQPPPVFALVDFDPDGIGILSNYKHGSFALADQNAELNVPGMRWLGVHTKDLLIDAMIGGSDGLLRLTARDRRKASLMLEKDIFAEDGPEVKWRRELQVMLMLNVKAEIQLLSRREGGLEGWLEESLSAASED